MSKYRDVTVQFRAVQCSEVQWSAAQCILVQCTEAQFGVVQCSQNTGTKTCLIPGQEEEAGVEIKISGALKNILQIIDLTFCRQ